MSLGKTVYKVKLSPTSFLYMEVEQKLKIQQ